MMLSEIMLAKGWLKRQMENVERDFATWPEWMKQAASRPEPGERTHE